MRQIVAFLMTLLMVTSCSASENDEPQLSPGNNDATYFDGKKILVAYFSWGGTTRRMAQTIQTVTGGDIFEIVPVNPYPTEYTPCTEVALEERDTDARPPIKDQVQNWEQYDIVFIGCPVWWHTAPMIISTFAESYDFAGKTVVPFCTYAATYRDETLQKIVDLTPTASHLEGLGTTGNTSGVQSWIERINAQWQEMSGIAEISSDNTGETNEIYNLQGMRVRSSDSLRGIYLVRNGKGTKKVAF